MGRPGSLPMGPALYDAAALCDAFSYYAPTQMRKSFLPSKCARRLVGGLGELVGSLTPWKRGCPGALVVAYVAWWAGRRGLCASADAPWLGGWCLVVGELTHRGCWLTQLTRTISRGKGIYKVATLPGEGGRPK